MSARLRLNVFTPLPPARTEIANQAVTVLGELARRADVTVWTEQSDAQAPAGVEMRRYNHEAPPFALFDRAHANFFHIGNNSEFHRSILAISRQVPGIVILHDTSLQHLMMGAYCADMPRDPDYYLACMRRFHGTEGERMGRELLNGTRTPTEASALFPLTRAALEGAIGCITHAAAAARELALATDLPVRHLPLAFDLAALPPPRRRRGGTADAPRRLVMFGHIGDNRCLPEALEALAGVGAATGFRLDVYGAVADRGAAVARIARLGLQTRVELHGFVPAATLHAALRQADLGLNLRSPTMGEASSAQLLSWAHSLPTLVTRAGWYGELPPGTVFHVAPGDEVQAIGRHLRAFAADPAPYEAAGKAGRAWLKATHGAAGYAEGMLALAAEAAERPDPRMLRAASARVRHAMAALGLQPTAKIESLLVPASDALAGSDVLHDTATGEATGEAIIGAVDVMAGGWVLGWAHCASAHGQSTQVSLFADGEEVGRAQAIDFRDDLRQAGIGDGRCGFRIVVPPGLMDTATTLLVRASCGQYRRVMAERDIAPAPRAITPAPSVLHVDLTDLLAYLSHHGTLSGIQRMQCGLIAGLMQELPPEALRFCVQHPDIRSYFEIPRSALDALIGRLTDDRSDVAGAGRAAARALLQGTDAGAARFAAADIVLVPGGVWAFARYHEAIRRVRAACGLRCVQLFYDAIPALLPETCEDGIADAYCASTGGMLATADLIAAISQCSAADLQALTSAACLPCPPIVTLPPGDGDPFRYRDTNIQAAPARRGGEAFVLCVGTLEPRKNHAYLFQVWKRLLARFGDRTPRLVCVGRMGWHTAEISRFLAATGSLDGFITIREQASDQELAALYRDCAFTIFPSLYEGWGLPVSESLEAGRLCVTSRSSAMPEAGGAFAVYLDPHNIDDGERVVARLIENPALVAEAEARIADTRTPRGWDLVARELMAAIGATLPEARGPRPAPLIAAGQTYASRKPILGGPAAQIRDAHEAAIFAELRAGAAWHPMEEWGCWASGARARIAMRLPDTATEGLVCHLVLSLPPYQRCTLRSPGGSLGRRLAVAQLSPVPRLVRLELPAPAPGEDLVIDMLLEQATWPAWPAVSDTRLLGIGLHLVHVCAAGDQAARLAFLESRVALLEDALIGR